MTPGPLDSPISGQQKKATHNTRGWKLSKYGQKQKVFLEVSPKKNPAQAGWPKRLGHVGTTQWADFAVITAQL